MEPLADVEGVRLLSLQKYHGIDQLERYGTLMGIEDLGRELDNDDQAFVDTAAVMKSLDLVITSDTATAHLAGAGRRNLGGVEFVARLAMGTQRGDTPVRLFTVVPAANSGRLGYGV